MPEEESNVVELETFRRSRNNYISMGKGSDLTVTPEYITIQGQSFEECMNYLRYICSSPQVRIVCDKIVLHRVPPPPKPPPKPTPTPEKVRPRVVTRTTNPQRSLWTRFRDFFRRRLRVVRT